MEFAHLGVAAAQQLDEEVRGDRAQALRRDRVGDAVHAIAPAPEVVLRTFAAFRESGECTLEGMTVGVDEAGQDRPGL